MKYHIIDAPNDSAFRLADPGYLLNDEMHRQIFRGAVTLVALYGDDYCSEVNFRRQFPSGNVQWMHQSGRAVVVLVTSPEGKLLSVDTLGRVDNG